jgi:hypothetical protein
MRRLLPPWTVEAIDGGFKVVDANKQAIAYVYGHADKRDAEIAKSMTLDETRRVAASIAKLQSYSLKGVRNLPAAIHDPLLYGVGTRRRPENLAAATTRAMASPKKHQSVLGSVLSNFVKAMTKSLLWATAAQGR